VPRSVDLVHQVVALHRGVERAGELMALALFTRMSMPPKVATAWRPRPSRLLVAHVDHDRQGLAARGLDLLGGGVDRARQLRVGLGGLRRDDDVGAVAGGAQRDREADAAARAGDEEGLSWLRGSVIALCSCAGSPRPRSGRRAT
jgi:hypothetical protein